MWTDLDGIFLVDSSWGKEVVSNCLERSESYSNFEFTFCFLWM